MTFVMQRFERLAVCLALKKDARRGVVACCLRLVCTRVGLVVRIVWDGTSAAMKTRDLPRPTGVRLYFGYEPVLANPAALAAGGRLRPLTSGGNPSTSPSMLLKQ